VPDEQLVIDGVATVPLRVGKQSTITEVLITRDINGLILGVDLKLFNKEM